MSGAPPPPPGYGPPGYGPPGYGPYAGPPQGSPKALWAMVTGIAGLVLGLCGCLGLVGLGGVVLGMLARRDIAASNGRLTGKGKATAGIVTGGIGAGIAVAWLVFVTIRLSKGENIGY